MLVNIEQIIQCPKCKSENILIMKKGDKVIVKCGGCKIETKI